MAEKNSFLEGMKGATGVIFALFLIFIVAPCTVCGGMATCGAILDETDDRSQVERESQQVQAEEQAQAEEAADDSVSDTETPEPRIGEPVELGDFAYTIEQPETTTELGPNIASTEAGSGAVFVVVDYTVENLTNETKTALSADFELRDYQGRQFRSSSEAQTALTMSDDTDFILSELQPGLARDLTTAFQVPEDATDEPLTLIIPEKGLMASDEIELRFQLP